MQVWISHAMSFQNKRDVNMDSLLLKQKMVAGTQLSLAAVCDGVGSMADGAFAAAQTVHELSSWMEALTDTRDLGLRMRDAVLQINQSILEQAQQQMLQTASTASVLLIADDCYYIVHSGDSRIYSHEKGVFEQLTHDHTLEGKLTSCLGRFHNPTLFCREGVCGEKKFLLCTDGLYKRQKPEFLSGELAQSKKRNLQKTIQRMVQHAVRCGETDNISAAIVLRES